MSVGQLMPSMPHPSDQRRCQGSACLATSSWGSHARKGPDALEPMMGALSLAHLKARLPPSSTVAALAQSHQALYLA